MTESLRDLLLKSGIAKTVPKAPRPAAPSGKAPARHGPAKPKPKAADGDIDLARAYAVRAQTEARDRAREQREAEQKARAKKEMRRKLQALLQGQARNKPEAEAMRHFEHQGKIRRVHVDEPQLRALNAGELGVVQLAGRYLIVSAEVAREAAAIDASVLALLVDPTAAPGVDADGIPDDLIW
ncbi:MAG TPA: DUF2058 family protein [Rhodanobacteraceae bacterium]|nr:DUF2058 family protein [Rhodanobacteraceae bacterium]